MKFLPIVLVCLLAGCGTPTPEEALQSKLQAMTKSELMNYSFTKEEAHLLKVPSGIPISALIGKQPPHLEQIRIGSVMVNIYTPR